MKKNGVNNFYGLSNPDTGGSRAQRGISLEAFVLAHVYVEFVEISSNKSYKGREELANARLVLLTRIPVV